MSPLPSKIGRYEIKSLIGRGGMGDLYLAWDPNTTRLVALKLLNATIDSIESRERFAREARALAALNHHNIVNIYDTGEFDDALFIVMEYVRGETLAEIIKRRAVLSVPQKLKLMAELCNGLAQAHEAGIIHRDIKPANLMVDQQGRLKILDFGIARVAGGSGTRVGLPLTQVNMVIGTTGYMSPEQIEGREVDHRSDIFAVGAVCYELFAYGEAFTGANTGQIERKVLQGQPAPLSSIVPGLDPEIDAIVLRALKKDPNKRYQDAATLERDLERLRLRLGQDPGLSPRRTAPPPPGGRGTSRDPRAEEAYQRALAADQSGATDAARRFAVEALAHDRSHAPARALLARLNPLSPLAGTAQSPGARRPAPPTVIITSTSQAVPSTVAGTPARKAPPTIASAPTIIMAPGAGAPSRWTQPSAFWSSDGPLRRRWDALWKRDPAASWARQRHEPLWTRYSSVLLTVSLVVLVALIVGGAVFFGRWLGPSGQLLTITRPVGGTISVAGMTCGPRDADCTVTRPTGDAIELRPEADAGYQFVGYKGDCAPSGRTIMTGPRTCGATFDKVDVQAPPATQPLTIRPLPQGGTITGVEIKCGSQGTVCSANYPDGEMADLYPVPDPGYTFMGFSEDCKSLAGHTKMTGPRFCGATFSPTPLTSEAPTPVTRSGGGRTGQRGRETSAAPVNDGTPPIPVAPEPSRGADPPAPVAVRPVPPPQGPVVAPITPEEFAKGKIREVLKEYCEAFVALDPAAVQRVYPKVDMKAMNIQLNRSKYRSIQCTFGDPMFTSLDAQGGTAKVQVDRKLVYDHVVGSDPPIEQIVDMTLSRQSERSPWQIESARFTTKKK